VTTTEAIELLEQFRAGKAGREKVLRAFQAAPVADLGFARVDTHRALRRGFPEVIFGAGKTPQQVATIAAKLMEHEHRVLVTRITPDHVNAVRKKFKEAVHHEQARCLTIDRRPLPKRTGPIAVVCAGTSDLPVAEEAAVTADIMGNRVELISDVGVAGVHRLFGQLDRHGGGFAECGGRVGFQTGDCGAHQRGLWRQFRRFGRAAGNVEQLRQRHDRGEYRQWLWRRVRGEPDKFPGR